MVQMGDKTGVIANACIQCVVNIRQKIIINNSHINANIKSTQKVYNQCTECMRNYRYFCCLIIIKMKNSFIQSLISM